MHGRVAKLMTAQLKELCALFGLQVSGTKEALVDSIIDFLNAPWDTMKKVAKKVHQWNDSSKL